MKVGLVGKVLGHSWSSKIHEAFFKEMGITGSYELIEVPQDKIDHFLPRLLSSSTDSMLPFPIK